uniref:Uncharacterized protein n=1 Tax=Plectus sambesii TaxID=2011161 RepID=A0A914V8H2_9BILA
MTVGSTGAGCSLAVRRLSVVVDRSLARVGDSIEKTELGGLCACAVQLLTTGAQLLGAANNKRRQDHVGRTRTISCPAADFYYRVNERTSAKAGGGLRGPPRCTGADGLYQSARLRARPGTDCVPPTTTPSPPVDRTKWALVTRSNGRQIGMRQLPTRTAPPPPPE